MTLSAVEIAIRRNRAQLLAGDANALSQMTAAYQPVRTRLIALIDDLAAEIARSGTITRSQALRFERATTLLQQVNDELIKFGADADSFIQSGQRQAVQLAAFHALAMANAMNPTLSTSWNRVNTAAVQNLVGRMSNGAPLRTWMDALGPETAATMEQRILDAIATGTNPRDVAKQIQEDLTKDVNLAGYRILNHTRTQLLNSYRAATSERFIANRDIVKGWRWLASLSDRTCRACLGMHMTFHDVDEPMKSHNQCRCSQAAELYDSEFPPLPTGDEWLAGQSEAVQASILGKEGAKDFRSGAVRLIDFAVLHKDEVWGDSYQVGSLDHALNRAEKRAA